MDEGLVLRFEKELDKRVTLRTNPSVLPYKVLLDAFKYFDMVGSGKVDLRVFQNIALIKFGVTGLSQDDIRRLFRFYSNNLETLDYRDFIAGVYDVSIPRSVAPLPLQDRPNPSRSPPPRPTRSPPPAPKQTPLNSRSPFKEDSIVRTSEQNLRNFPPDISLNFEDPRPAEISHINASLDENRSRAPLPSPACQKLKEVLRKMLVDSGRPELLLHIEFGLVRSCENIGCLDFDIFANELDKYGLLRPFKTVEASQLFLSFASPNQAFNVQRFANELRGQMGPSREHSAIQLFRRLSPHSSDLSMRRFRSAFLPNRFRSKAFRTSSEVQRMWDDSIDLFEVLNLPVRKYRTLQLDEFLYLLDNFSLVLSEAQFEDFIGSCFA